MVMWHEDDEFWIKMIPVLFPPVRIKATHGEFDAILSMVGIQGGTVLDLGCGVGWHSLELAKRGFKVTGVDRTMTISPIRGGLHPPYR